MFRNRLFTGYRNLRAHALRSFAYSSQQADDQKWIRAPLIGAFAAAGILAYQQNKNEFSEAEEDPNKPMFSIPKMLQDREEEKRKEYAEREKVDVEKMIQGISQEELDELSEADQAMLLKDQEMTDVDNDELEDERIRNIVDPYVRKRASSQAQQEFRQLQVADSKLLKQGQMVQIAVCDPMDENKFHPTDKIILCKHQGEHHALGSFCGFDFTNLATGALIGEKLICPTCGSNYDIKNGYVDQGPSMRSLSSFVVNERDGKVNVTVPEHIPAFSRKNMLKRSQIDPRNFVILGDSETALSAIDALRTGYTGQITLIPVSQYGAFENIHNLRSKFGPLSKNETHYLEDNFLEKANVTVETGQIKHIDIEEQHIKLAGHTKPIKFDKMLIAWGAHKKRLKQEYQNVFYLEDRQAHAKCHNEILRANCIVVMGNTIEAYQSAASIRSYLDSIGYRKTQIVLLSEEEVEVNTVLGKRIGLYINALMREQRISVISKAKITEIKGMSEIEGIYFTKANQNTEEHYISGDQTIEYFLKPDVVICENGLGDPKMDLATLIENREINSISRLAIANDKTPMANIRFSLMHNELQSPFLAAGACTYRPAFMQKLRLRTDDVKYNIEAGFYAAMNLMDKQVQFNFIPMTSLKIGDTPIYFVGERANCYHEIITAGSPKSGKFIQFYCFGDEIVGFCTVGYQNLHLWLWEAMKRLIMPTAGMMRAHGGDFKSIVQAVLRMAPEIEAGRQHTINIPSVLRAEFTREIDELNVLRGKFKAQMDELNQQQKVKAKKMKDKLDRDGVEIKADEEDIGREDQKGLGPKPGNPTIMPDHSKRYRNPYSSEDKSQKSVNLGGSGGAEQNPLKLMAQMVQNVGSIGGQNNRRD